MLNLITIDAKTGEKATTILDDWVIAHDAFAVCWRCGLYRFVRLEYVNGTLIREFGNR